MAATFTWLTLSGAISALQARLNDAGVFWPVAELKLYLQEALRLRNALCEDWRQDFTFQVQGCTWNNLGTLSGSPRLRTVTDIDLYTQMQAMLLEPMTGGGTWTGTNQFTLAKLQYALSRRRNEMIQAMACNLADLSPIVAGVSTRRYTVPDTTLELRRVRYLMLLLTTTGTAASGASSIALAATTGIRKGNIVQGTGIASGCVVTGVASGSVTLSIPTTAALASTTLQFYQPITLTREDTQAFQDFNPAYLQDTGIPQSWSVASEPPLSFDVDRALNVPGEMDVLALQSGPVFAPPTATLLGVPDDWSWVAMYGALADLLSEEPESTDRQRSAYCLKRFQDGLKMFAESNWMLQGTVNGVACATPAVASKDWFLPEWETEQGQIPCIVQGGVDFVAVAPSTPATAALTLVQNAPILDSTGTYVQCSEDSWESILDAAHHLAAFKMGGSDFADTLPLLDSFFQKCQQDNKRVRTYGLYVDILDTAGKEQEIQEPR